MRANIPNLYEMNRGDKWFTTPAHILQHTAGSQRSIDAAIAIWCNAYFTRTLKNYLSIEREGWQDALLKKHHIFPFQPEKIVFEKKWLGVSPRRSFPNINLEHLHCTTNL